MRTPKPHQRNANFFHQVGMKPLSERDENKRCNLLQNFKIRVVGMKPLSERDENQTVEDTVNKLDYCSRNEATL